MLSENADAKRWTFIASTPEQLKILKNVVESILDDGEAILFNASILVEIITKIIILLVTCDLL